MQYLYLFHLMDLSGAEYGKRESWKKITIAGANALALSWEVKSLSDCHKANMQIILANVSCCLLWYKLIKGMPIVCHFPCDLQQP
jgi:hypothetical protein